MARKIFPKIKKKLKGFLTDESGKISKKDALGLAVGGVVLSGIDEVGAAVTHANGVKGDGLGGSTSFDYDITYTDGTAQCTVNHASGLVNGHYSGTPDHTLHTTLGGVTDVTGHSSHGSHGSHGSHSSCCGGSW